MGVERSDNYSLKPNDSYRVTLKIKCLDEVEMGSISCVTPRIDYNPKGYLGNITDKKIYCKIWIYDSIDGRRRGVSGCNAFQSAADQYNIFMSELTEIWREEMIDSLIKDQIIQKKTVNKDEPLSMDQMYESCKSLHRRCKDKKKTVWNDMQSAFDKAFGGTPMTNNYYDFRNDWIKLGANHFENRNIQ